MPHAPVDEKGTLLHYEDSGAPEDGQDYTTVILIHGTIFHAETFRPMLPFAKPNNLRLVRFNLRDYPGSTPWSQSDIDAIVEKRENAKDIIEGMGQELGAFLAWFIETEHVPRKISGSSQSGGISVLAWSMGNIVLLSLLAHLEKLSRERRELIEAYLRSFVMLDPSYYLFGLPAPSLDEVYHPLRDPFIPPSERTNAFMLWISTYFEHDVSTADLSSTTYPEFVSGLAHKAGIPDVVPTIQRMSPEELASVTDHAGAQRAHLAVRALDRAIFEDNFRHALLKKDFWPDLRVEYIWCTKSVDETLYSAWYLAQVMGKGSDTRIFNAHALESNHFPHWDQAETFTAYLARIV